MPFRTNVRLQPTTECLVHLSDPPFLVVTLADIEIASLERVQFGLKQFDMVLIFKDFTKTPLHINSIPTSQLDDVKNWLEFVLSTHRLSIFRANVTSKSLAPSTSRSAKGRST